MNGSVIAFLKGHIRATHTTFGNTCPTQCCLWMSISPGCLLFIALQLALDFIPYLFRYNCRDSAFWQLDPFFFWFQNVFHAFSWNECPLMTQGIGFVHIRRMSKNIQHHLRSPDCPAVWGGNTF